MNKNSGSFSQYALLKPHSNSLEKLICKQMVSPWAPHLAPPLLNFYMSSLENYVLSQDKISNPIFYVRYVDDILTVFRSNNHLSHFKCRLISNSVLNFTHETMVDDNFHFLDVNMHLSNNRITTSIYIKPTNNGSYIDFKSYTLDQYKVSTIKTLVYRALKLSSTWTETILEINRLKQIFANCNYPQAIVDKTVRICMDKYICPPPPDENTDNNSVSFYVQFYNLSTFKSDRKTLKLIVSHHVKPINNTKSVSVIPFYRTSKLSSCFSTRPTVPHEKRTRIVYRYNCTEDRCNASYVGIHLQYSPCPMQATPI